MTRTLIHGATSLVVAYATAGVLAAQTTSSPTASQAGQRGQVTGSAAPVVYTGCLKSGGDLAGGSALTPGASSSAPLSGYVLTGARQSPSTSPGASPQINPGMTNPGSTGRVPGTTPGTTSPGTSATPPAAAPPPGQSPTTTTPPATPPTTTPQTATPPAATPSTTTPSTASSTTSPSTAMSGTGTNSGTMYRIVGLPDQELQKFANQQVEIRGVLESPNKTATTGTPGAPTSSQPSSTTNPATGTSGTTAAVGTSSASASGQLGTIPSFRATSIRVISSSCAGGTN